MKANIENYHSQPGAHCGSTAMASLLYHYCELELPEAAVFGLGAGVGSVYKAEIGQDPAVILYGRTMNMELDVGRALGLDYREQEEPDNDVAWQKAREEIIAGRPTMLAGDIFFLDYREFKVRFPGHRYVLLGFDDESKTVQIADRIRPEPEICSYQALFDSRNPPDGLASKNLTGKFHSTKPTRNLTEASDSAIQLCAKRMLGLDTDLINSTTTTHGIAANHRFADELAHWNDRADKQWLAVYNAQCIEKFGNGGGNFRLLYAAFLKWARALDDSLVPAEAPTLALRAAEQWTAVSESLFIASDDSAPTTIWQQASDRAKKVAETEQILFESLAH